MSSRWLDGRSNVTGGGCREELSRALAVLFLPLLAMATSAGCGSDDGFGADGERVPPPVDTGPFGTGGTSDSAADSGTGTDTGSTDSGTDTDSADTADTGLGIEGTGYGAGDVAYNFKAPDQNDDIWALYGQYGSVTLLVFGDATNVNFQDIAAWLPGLRADYGVSTAMVLLTDNSSTQADVDDAGAWASQYGLSTVLYRPLDGSVSTQEWASRPPMFYVIDQGLNIDWTNQGYTGEGQVEDKVTDLLGI